MEPSVFLQVFLEQGLITASDRRKVLEIYRKEGVPIGKVLIDQKILSEKTLYDYICDTLGMNPENDYSEWSYGIAGMTIPRYNVSGDFFGFFPLDDGMMAITLCDVSGKGPEAGILAIILANILRKCIRMRSIVPSAIIRGINHASMNIFADDQFAAFGVIVLNMYTGTIEFCCAGTPPILVYRKETDDVEELEVVGIPIGIDEDFFFYNSRTRLSRGDVLLIFSDGAYEAQNLSGRFFGLSGIKQSLREDSGKSVRRILNSLKWELRLHTLLRGLNDDTTFVVVKKLKTRI